MRIRRQTTLTIALTPSARAMDWAEVLVMGSGLASTVSGLLSGVSVRRVCDRRRRMQLPFAALWLVRQGRAGTEFHGVACASADVGVNGIRSEQGDWVLGCKVGAWNPGRRKAAGGVRQSQAQGLELLEQPENVLDRVADGPALEGLGVGRDGAERLGQRRCGVERDEG